MASRRPGAFPDERRGVKRVGTIVASGFGAAISIRGAAGARRPASCAALGGDAPIPGAGSHSVSAIPILVVRGKRMVQRRPSGANCRLAVASSS
jgi:hypothetical protein